MATKIIHIMIIIKDKTMKMDIIVFFRKIITRTEKFVDGSIHQLSASDTLVPLILILNVKHVRMRVLSKF